MTGWQRFFLLFIFCCAVMICWPQYDTSGVTFMVMAFVLWTCVIMLLSVLINLFAIDKWEFLHRLLSIAFLLVMLGSLLYYFPLPQKQTPFTRLAQHQWPTTGDIQEGLKRFTFNFDFVRRNARNEKNYINQKIDKAPEDAEDKTKQFKQAVQKQKEKLETLIEKLEDKK